MDIDKEINSSLPPGIGFERNSVDLDEFLLSLPEDNMFDSEFIDTVSRSSFSGLDVKCDFFLQIEVFLDFYDSDLDADGFLDLVRTYLATFQDRFLLIIYLQDVIVDVPT